MANTPTHWTEVDLMYHLTASQWTFVCFILFNTFKDKICRTSLCNIFMLVSEFYSFNLKKRHGMIHSNIFLKNYCIKSNPRSGKEPETFVTYFIMYIIFVVLNLKHKYYSQVPNRHLSVQVFVFGLLNLEFSEPQ